MNPFFSVIIPVYNRPQELAELLDTLVYQSNQNFEVVVIEDGSDLDAANVAMSYTGKLDVRYFVKPNSGQGYSRNYGFERARGEFFIILDSDVFLPANYLQTVYDAIKRDSLYAFGGPDAAHESFNNIQKAISYAMTSMFTTGGIRGAKINLGGTFHPRSFNMGLSRKVYETLGGFKITRLGEDIEYSLRIQNAHFKSRLLPNAFVYHKRRSTMSEFWKQTHFFGRARINIFTFYPKGLKPVHFLPALFTVYVGFTVLCIPLLWFKTFTVAACGLAFYSLCIFADALLRYKNLAIALLSVEASGVQLIGYGIGFITDLFKRVIFKALKLSSFVIT